MKRITTTLIDDLDETSTEDVRTVYFGFEGKNFEIDLSEENANELERILGLYITNGRRISSAPPRRLKKQGSSGQTGSEALPMIRAWAKDKGIEIGDRGRIPASVVERYYREAGK